MACCKRAAVATTRVVHANDHAANAPSRFPDNAISNTKYNVLTFIPYNLMEQFG
jgi:phospholipid-translocating ATPase